jgi:YidC/Oxa1 family membrane protein insertase
MSFEQIIMWPFSWLLLHLYEWFTNYGVAIIIFTIIIKLVFLPFQMKGKRGSMRMAKLNPLVKELEKKYGDDKQKYQLAVQKLYKDEGVSPMSGCIWNLIPLPILFMLYSIIRMPLTRLMNIGAEAYTRIQDIITGTLGLTLPTGANAEIAVADIVEKNFASFQGVSDRLIRLDYNFLGMNLGNVPSYQVWNYPWNDPAALWPTIGLFLLPLISAGMTFLSMKISAATNPAMTAQQNNMKGFNMMMPIMSVVIGFTMPAALCVYWIIQSLTGAVQDFILNKHYTKIVDAEDAERRERLRAQEEELERKRLETERKRALGETERNKSTSKKKLQAAEKTKTEERLAKERAEEKAQRRAALGLPPIETPASQVGTRRYARGRAYVSDRFTNPEEAEEATKQAAAYSEIDDEVDKEYESAGEHEAAEAEGGDEE